VSALLTAAGVVRRYASPAGEVLAVRGVSLEVHKGETLGLVGESGCGKSTLARVLLGLEPPQEGQLTFLGQGFSSLGDPTVRRRLQAVFQDPGGALDPRLRIGPAVEEPLVVHSLGDRSSRAARVKELLDAVQLPQEVASRLPHELSAGQRQRVNLARALALDP
jgi:peptide/nickel transport system ATP-binding protein